MDRHSAAPARRSSPLLDRGAGIVELSKSDKPIQFLQYFDMMIKAPRRKGDTAASAKSAPAPAASGPVKKIILIGSSTGGVEALRTVLRDFPADCPPTLIVQHTGKNCGQGLVALLDKNSAPQVVPAQDTEPLTRGKVYICAGQKSHLGLTSKRPHQTRLKDGPPISGHVPSVDALFHSAVPFAKQVVATILTGMGQDGAKGLLELRKAGATTFAQDEKSSIVYGMPRVAWEMGGAEKQVPLGRMGAALLQASKA
jgi:two-component system chemotaxis response regulator CheB